MIHFLREERTTLEYSLHIEPAQVYETAALLGYYQAALIEQGVGLAWPRGLPV